MSIENRAIRNEILTIYAHSDKRLGAYKIRQRLIVEYGRNISAGRVYRLMKSMTLPKMSTVKPVSTRLKAEQPNCSNLLEQRFNPKGPNQIWAGDITFVRVNGIFCYVCVIMDLFSRKIIAYKAGSRINTQLTIETLRLACSRRNHTEGTIFHSDRGCQYTSGDYRKETENTGIIQSFSAKGHPYDNAVVESFFKYLKHEELNRRSYANISELNDSLFAYIDGFYNAKRPHGANNGLSPNEKEAAIT